MVSKINEAIEGGRFGPQKVLSNTLFRMTVVQRECFYLLMFRKSWTSTVFIYFLFNVLIKYFRHCLSSTKMGFSRVFSNQDTLGTPFWSRHHPKRVIDGTFWSTVVESPKWGRTSGQQRPEGRKNGKIFQIDLTYEPYSLTFRWDQSWHLHRVNI